jgi:HSP20 family molecular chaperone IbpA
MTRLSLFDSPLLLGFDDIERTLERLTKSSGGGYPPYNIEQIGETHLRITLAVAGFTEDDLSIAMEDRQLVIRGRQQESEEDENRVFLHRGIASRQFQRMFVLSDDIEVTGANMENGLLYIDLVRILPEKEVRHIQINKSDDASKSASKGTLSIDGKAKSVDDKS